ncbi:hypothetical protein P8452_66593 [Trifolium repens]|nr:hypothetical protein P8452_66593 [Trifolium repens]
MALHSHSLLIHIILQTLHLYLLDLVRLVYSPNENQSSASDAIIGVLKRHNQNIDIIFLLLDCLNYNSKTLNVLICEDTTA